jgi:NitT/TauT family transport system substrate-binding protein
VFLDIHRKASEYAMAHRAELVQMAGAKLGFPADVANLAADNVELTWKIDEDWIKRSKYYGALMLERKQIRKLPDYSSFIVTGLNPQ